MRVRFGDFTLDSNTRELAERGEPRHLSKKAFLLLELLIQNAPRALTKQEMYRHLWGDTFVEEVNLPNLVAEIRSILRENRKKAQFIRTVHGYGYAFSGDVRSEKEAPRTGTHIYFLRWGRDEFPLREGENVVGRGAQAEVVIDSAGVSRRHARIVVTANTATIEDLDSKNGTFVCGQRLRDVVLLRDHDEVRLGHVTVVFRISSRTDSTVTRTTS